jgi:hypothetical protein
LEEAQGKLLKPFFSMQFLIDELHNYYDWVLPEINRVGEDIFCVLMVFDPTGLWIALK